MTFSKFDNAYDEVNNNSIIDLEIYEQSKYEITV